MIDPLVFLEKVIPLVTGMFGQPGGGQGSRPGGDMSMFLVMIVIFLIFYFLLIRPQAKTQKKLQETLNALKKGDRVITTGGIFGTVVGLSEKTIQLKVADKVRIHVLRSAISGLDTEGSTPEFE